MSSLRVALLLACALLSVACSDPRHRAETQLRNGGDKRLRHDAALLYLKIFSGHGKPDFVNVWYKDWPPSFQKLAPRDVGAYIDGFSIALASENLSQRGLYVVPESMDQEPKATPGTRFEKLADGIYWYSFGK